MVVLRELLAALTSTSCQSKLWSHPAPSILPSPLDSRAASSSVTWQIMSYCLAFIETVIYKKILPPWSTPNSIRLKHDAHFVLTCSSVDSEFGGAETESQGCYRSEAWRACVWQSTLDDNSGGCLQATSEMSELQVALSEGELTLSNSMLSLLAFFSHLVERSVRNRKSFFLLLKCFVGAVVQLLWLWNVKNLLSFGRHLLSISVQVQPWKTQGRLAVSQSCISICPYFCMEIPVFDNCSQHSTFWQFPSSHVGRPGPFINYKLDFSSVTSCSSLCFPASCHSKVLFIKSKGS